MVEFYVTSTTTTIPLGRQGENLARTIYFELAEMIEEYGDGTATLVCLRSKDDAPYVVTTSRDGVMLTWSPTSTDTAYAGGGKCELRWVVNDVLAKSIVYRTTVTESITGDSTVPSQYESWYDAMVAYLNSWSVSGLSAVGVNSGYVPTANGSGGWEWLAQSGGSTDPSVIAQAVSDWLDEHPEATTTVEDYSLGYEKLKKGTLGFVTPEMYGAVGDGTTDDTTAIQTCIDSNPGKTILLIKNYLVSAPIQTSAADNEKVRLEGTKGGRLKASAGFSGSWVLDICGKGTRASLSDTDNVVCVDGLTIDTNGVCGGVLVERCQMARVTNLTIINLGAYTGLQIDKPSEADDINSSDAYVDNVLIFGNTSNVEACTGMIVNGHDNDIRNVRTNYVNIGIVVNGSHNRIANAHPLRGTSDNGFTIYENSKAFVINNNFVYLTDCYSDNFAVGIDVKAGAIFFLTNFTLLWWENYNVTHTFIKLEDDGETPAANRIFWGHIKGADLLFKTNGLNSGIDGDFHANTYIRNPNCISGIYVDKTTVSSSDALFDTRLSDNKIDDFNYNATVISDLSAIPEGTSGRARFVATVSPTGENSIFIYECIGDSTRKIINAYYPSNKKRYINSYTGSWTGWEEF